MGRDPHVGRIRRHEPVGLRSVARDLKLPVHGSLMVGLRHVGQQLRGRMVPGGRRKGVLVSVLGGWEVALGCPRLVAPILHVILLLIIVLTLVLLRGTLFLRLFGLDLF